MVDLSSTDRDTAVKALHFIVMEADSGRLMMDKAQVDTMRDLMVRLIGAPCECLWCKKENQQ